MSQSEAASAISRVEMSQSLRGSLQRALTHAFEQSHRQVMLEHLLLALTEDREAAVILESSAVDVPALTSDVKDYLARLEDRVAPGERREPGLGGDVQHIIQSAGAAAQKSRRREISSALVLAAVVGDGRSPSAQMLRDRGLTFENAIQALKQVNAPPKNQAAPPQKPATATTPVPQENASQESFQGDARLQNVQAAHDIIANARERIAAARGAIAAKGDAASRPQRVDAPSPVTEPSKAQPAAQTSKQRQSESSPALPTARSEPKVAPSRVTSPPAGPPAVSSVVAANMEPPGTPFAAEQARPPRADAPRPELQPRIDSRQAPPVPARPAAAVPTVDRDPAVSAPISTIPLPNAPTRPYPGGMPAAQQPPPRAEPPVTPHDGRNAARPPANPPPRGPRPAARHPHMPPAPHRPQSTIMPAPEQRAPPTSAPVHQSPPATPIDPAELAAAIPRRMRAGRRLTVEIRAPRAGLEAWSGGTSDPRARDAREGQIITKAMAMRLKAPEGGLTIEIASPETQWSEGVADPLSDDIVSWRWTITPTRSGRHALQLNTSTRVVCRDGLAAATSLPEQRISVRVSPNYGRLAGRIMLGLALAVGGVALGYFGEGLFSMGRSVLAQVMLK